MNYHLSDITYNAAHLYGETPPEKNPEVADLQPLTEKFIELVQSPLFQGFISKQFSALSTINLDFRIEADDIILTYSSKQYSLKYWSTHDGTVGETAKKILTVAKTLWKDPRCALRPAAQTANSIATQVSPPSCISQSPTHSIPRKPTIPLIELLEVTSPGVSSKRVITSTDPLAALSQSVLALTERIESLSLTPTQNTSQLEDLQTQVREIAKTLELITPSLNEERANSQQLNASQEATHQSSITTMTHSHEQAITALEKAHTAELSSIRDSSAESTAELEAKLRAAQAAHQTALEALQAESTQRLATVSTELTTCQEANSQLAQRAHILESSTQELQESLERITTTASETIEDLSASLEQAARVIEFLSADRIQEFTQLQATREEAIISEARAILEEQAATLQTLHEQELSELSRTHQGELEQLTQTVTTQIQALNDASSQDVDSRITAATLEAQQEIEHLQALVNQLEAKIEEATAAITQAQTDSPKETVEDLQRRLELQRVTHLEEIYSIQAELDQLLDTKLASYAEILLQSSTTLELERTVSTQIIHSLQAQIDSLTSTESSLSEELASLNNLFTDFQKEHEISQAYLADLVEQNNADSSSHLEEIKDIRELTELNASSQDPIIQLKEQIHALQELLMNEEAASFSAKEMIQKLISAITDLRSQNETLNKDVVSLTTESSSLRAHIASADLTHTEALASTLRSQETIRDLMSQFTDLETSLETTSQEFSNQIDELKRTIAQRDSTVSELSETNSRQTARITLLQQEIVRLTQDLEKRDAIYTKIETAIREERKGRKDLLPQIQALQLEKAQMQADFAARVQLLEETLTQITPLQEETQQQKVFADHMSLLNVLRQQTDFVSPSLGKIDAVLSERGLASEHLSCTDLIQLNTLSLAAIREFLQHTVNALRQAQQTHDSEVLQLEGNRLVLEDRMRELQANITQVEPITESLSARNAALQEELENLRKATIVSGHLIKAQSERLRGLQETVQTQEDTLHGVQEDKAELAAKNAAIQVQLQIQTSQTEALHIQQAQLNAQYEALLLTLSDQTHNLSDKDHVIHTYAQRIEDLQIQQAQLNAQHESHLELLSTQSYRLSERERAITTLEQQREEIIGELTTLGRTYASTLITPYQREKQPTPHTQAIEIIHGAYRRINELEADLETLNIEHGKVESTAAQRRDKIKELEQNYKDITEALDALRKTYASTLSIPSESGESQTIVLTNQEIIQRTKEKISELNEAIEQLQTDYSNFFSDIFTRLGGGAFDPSTISAGTPSDLIERVIYPLIDASRQPGEASFDSQSIESRSSSRSSLAGRTSIVA